MDSGSVAYIAVERRGLSSGREGRFGECRI